MTQDEVDLIYDYLHENYRYEDGNLISIKSRPGVGEGKILGFFAYQEPRQNERPRMTCNITINKKHYCIRLSHLIYLYHKKIKPAYIYFKDNNSINTKIENLEEIYPGQFRNHSSIKKRKGFANTPYNKPSFCTRLMYKGKIIFCINYHDKNTSTLAYKYANTLLYDKKIELAKIQAMVLEKFPKPVRSKSGFTGVYKVSKNRFMARIGAQSKCLGYFDTPQEAHEAYLKAKKELSDGS